MGRNYSEPNSCGLIVIKFFVISFSMGYELKLFFNQVSTLEESVWHELEATIAVRHLEKGDYFLREGEICQRLGFIVSGATRVFFLTNGEDITKDFNFENSFCGSYASFSRQEASRFNVQALEPLKLYTLGRNDLYRLFDKHVSLQKAGRIFIEQMFIRKEQREASFLLDSPDVRYAKLLALHPLIENRVPLKFIASYLGIRPETLSRIRANTAGKQS